MNNQRSLTAASMLGDWLKLRARRRQWQITFEQFFPPYRQPSHTNGKNADQRLDELKKS